MSKRQKVFNIQQEFLNKDLNIKDMIEIIVNTETDDFQDFIDFEYFGEFRTYQKKDEGMTKKDFISHYGINAPHWSKAWKIIVMLFKAGDLSIESFCEAIVKEVDIVRLSGVCKSTLELWKRESRFVYVAVREKSIRCLVDEYENYSSGISHNFKK